jgi:DNA-binding transcriptional regulator GbsR (MarR family)
LSPNADLRTYIEELTLVLEEVGLPRTSGRVLAWLLVCKPAEQTMNDLMDALQMSKSSVSAATQALIQYKLIERVSLPGERRDYYRMREGLWGKVMATQVDQTRHLREVAEKGLRMIDGITTQTHHIEEMLDYARFLEEEMPLLLARWNARKLELQGAPEG